MIDVKDGCVALKKRLKFSDKIEEQQKILNKLKLQQELSKTLAEKAVYELLKYEELLLQQHEIELLNKTPEQKFNWFMNQKDVDKAYLTASNLLPQIINTSCVDTQDPIFPAISSPTGKIHLVNHQSSANQQQEANIADLHQITAAGNQSILDLGTGYQANLHPEINNTANPQDHKVYPPASQPTAALDNLGIPSTHHASITRRNKQSTPNISLQNREHKRQLSTSSTHYQ